MHRNELTRILGEFYAINRFPTAAEKEELTEKCNAVKPPGTKDYTVNQINYWFKNRRRAPNKRPSISGVAQRQNDILLEAYNDKNLTWNNEVVRLVEETGLSQFRVNSWKKRMDEQSNDDIIDSDEENQSVENQEDRRNNRKRTAVVQAQNPAKRQPTAQTSLAAQRFDVQDDNGTPIRRNEEARLGSSRLRNPRQIEFGEGSSGEGNADNNQLTPTSDSLVKRHDHHPIPAIIKPERLIVNTMQQSNNIVKVEAVPVNEEKERVDWTQEIVMPQNFEEWKRMNENQIIEWAKTFVTDAVDVEYLSNQRFNWAAIYEICRPESKAAVNLNMNFNLYSLIKFHFSEIVIYNNL